MSFSKSSRLGLLAIALICCIATAFSGHRKNTDASHDKARYYYLKGVVSNAEGKNDEAYEFYKKAAALDPEFADATFAFGFTRMALAEDTFMSREEIKRNLSLMRGLVDRYPGDVQAAERYAYAAAIIDSFPEVLRIYNILVREKPGLSRLYLPLSYYHVSAGNVDSAVYAIREYERLEGATTETTVRKVTYWLSRQDTLAALAEARLYAETNPGKPEPLIDKAMIYNLLGQQDSAIIFLENALLEFPEKSEMKFDIALLYAEKGDSARFHKLVAEAFRGEDLEYEDKMSILDVYSKNLPFNASDYTESDKLFDYASKEFSQDADFFDLYATYDMVKGDYNAALQKEKKAMALNPTEPSFLGRVISFSILGDEPETGMHAFENFPDPEARNRYPLMLAYVSAAQAAKDYNKATQWLDTIISLQTPGLDLMTTLSQEKADSLIAVTDPSSLYKASASYEVAGDIYARIERHEDALRTYENSILLMPNNNPSALNNYAWFIIESLKPEPGSELFEKAKDMSWRSLEQTLEDPQSTYLDTYAWILFKEGSYKEALDYIETAVEKDGSSVSAELLSHFGDILFMNGRSEDAVEQWEKGLKLDPSDRLLKKKVEGKTYYAE